MGKGDWRRPSQIPDKELEKKYEELFGTPKLNIMSEEDRRELGIPDRDASGPVHGGEPHPGIVPHEGETFTEKA